MNSRRITYIAIIILFIAFSVYVFLYERHVRNDAQSRVDEYAFIIADALWTYNPQSISQYLTLACISHDHEDLVVTDTSGQVFYAAVGKEPGGFERLLMSLNLIPSVRFVSDVVYQGEKIGQIEATWNSKTIYVHAYVLFALVMILAIFHLFVRTLHSRNELKERTNDLKARTTELQDAQEELLRAERLVTLGQFTGSISHELRNNLGVIDSSVYYLMKIKLKDADEKVQEHFDRIKSSVGSSTAIIESLLNLTRMKDPELSRLDLAVVISDAIATSKVPAKVKVTRNFPEQEVPVSGDLEQLGMVFKNIIKNAVEAMDGKGTLKITVGTDADGRPEVSFADSGPGIAQEDLGKVFQPLFSTKAKGIGFGLSIAKMVVDKHGGTIEAESKPKKGATIVVKLPYSVKDKDA